MNQLKQLKIDPITSQVIRGALENIAIEMGHKLARMSYSSIIRESEDFGCALVDMNIQQLCESTQSTPLQSGPIPGYVRGILTIFNERGEEFYPGDVIIHNSTYHGASHGPDIGICVPVFYNGELIGFSVTTAHHLDIGALTPGSCGIVDATDAYAEGLQFKAIKVYEKGEKNRFIWNLLRDNIRASDMVVGDIEAQIAAANIGAERYIELVNKYSLETVLAASEDLMRYSETMLRNEIEKLPDGTYYAEGFIDGYVDSDDPMKKDLKIAVTVTISGSDIKIDLTGSSPQVNRPINMPFEGTVDCAIYLTLRSILLDSTVFGNIPQNSGLIRPIEITAPKGTICNPIFPAPTIARFCPGNIVASTLMKALGQVVPNQISAGVGNLKVVSYSGLEEEDYWVFMDIVEGSYGGRSGLNGMDAVDTLYANTRNNPIEDIESHYPLRVSRYELRNEACAAGKWRGGVGSIKEVTFLKEGSVSLEADGHKHAPWGFAGGDDGYTGAVTLNPGTNREKQLPSMVPNTMMRKGDTLLLTGPSGGGYGNPFEREPKDVLTDVIDELITVEMALEQYGVVIREDLTVDLEKTTDIRHGKRDE
ncbi:hydantoinase B/oxoprolinase family protein [Alkalihalobacillus oceani]|uniref:hydantoinase B/oxoprolinase family protein n=1 Tax=Halalkalibacter oceani TaxID=1653776 RepID=UPI00203DDA48|nr:hydantoinase B/oxoprolinase family protein [Halalkalibacter oceani]MCM3760143.1 hydantoinase B/oxoprolinase family protein [Halalkalibacter oceani]